MGMKKVVILGSLGMLGQELTRIFSLDEQYTVLAWDKADIDITDFALFAERLSSVRPDIVINAAAYNAVDLCEESEEEYAKALLLNRDVPGFLAKESMRLGFLLIHYSTDYVFDGAVEKVGYNEEALPHPLSRYGLSKFEGEQAVREKAKEYFIIRLSKLFGKPASAEGAKQSFFEKMLEAGRAKPEVVAVDGEKSCFTYAPDLAVATKELIESKEAYGTYHLMNEGAVTWYEGARELYLQAGLQTEIKPVGSGTFLRAAKRPPFSVLLNTKRPKLRPYTEALKEYLYAINKG